MIDRPVHHAKVLTLTGDSYRTRQRRELLAKQNRADPAEQQAGRPRTPRYRQRTRQSTQKINYDAA
jgi:hypothetical protein